MASKHAIICVHGAGAKPPEAQLRQFWRDAVRQGVARSEPEALEAYDQSEFEMLYWASAVEYEHAEYDVELDIQQRHQVLERLGELRKGRDFRRRHYDDLPGKTALKEFAMDSAAVLGMSGLVWPRLMPELGHYWRDESGWAEAARNRLAVLLTSYAEAGYEVLLLSHCMGAVLSYDTLCETELAKRLPLWITMGSPISSNSVKKRLWGMQAGQYPANILEWHNIAAEDDYVCHDKAVADDFKTMLDRRLLGDLRDHTIYNLAVRYGRSNPHHSTGYLAHPRTARLVGHWLTAQSLDADES